MIGLPSLQALDRAQATRIWLATEATDMRCGFDRLAERVRAVVEQNPLSGNLFVFRSRRGDRLKILLWDRDGFLLWYKRLEVGMFELPRVQEGERSVELRASELAMVLELALICEPSRCCWVIVTWKRWGLCSPALSA
jgi:transposase